MALGIPPRAASLATDWELTAAEAAFRDAARSWVAREVREPYLDGLGARSATSFFGIEPEFSRRLGAAGLLGVTTPAAHGGAGRSQLEQALLQAELAWHDAPILGHFVAEHEVLPALLRFGTAAQRERHVPALLAGRMLCSQGFTEPGAGSDLAAVATTATPTARGFVLRGEKWLNSVAHVADALWLIVRSGPQPRHRGLSMLLVPVATPGIRVEPLAEMTGARRLNRLVFEDAEVDADCLVGELHGGWAVAMDTVARERAGAARPARVRRLIAELVDHVPDGAGRRLGDDEAAALALAQLAVRAEACELLWLRYARETDAGVNAPDLAGTTLKVYADAVEQELADLATTLLGRRGALDVAPSAPLGGRVARLHLAAPGLSLGGGTSEVLKRVVATRGLGLPRAPAGGTVASGAPRAGDGPRADAADAADAPTARDGSGPRAHAGGTADAPAAPTGSDAAAPAAPTAGDVAARAAAAGVVEPLAAGTGDLQALVAVARAAGSAGASGLLVPHVVLPAVLLGAASADGALTTALGDGAEDLDCAPGPLRCRLRAGAGEHAGAFVLDGVKPFVAGALDADAALVLVRADAGAALALVRVALSADGVRREPLAAIGRGRDADVRFDAVPVEAATVLDGEPLRERLARARAVATLVQAAEGVGAIERLLELSVEQGHARHAFGRPVGTFESFQGACAEIAMERELARTVVDHAAWSGRAADAVRARAFAGDAAVRAAGAALQLQGGRGFLDDAEVARLYRVAKASQLRWGSPRHHLRDVARGLGSRTDATGELLPRTPR